MSEFWKSNPKKFCEYCKVWITDNKPSIAIHESGKNHKDMVKAKLDEIGKKVEQRKIEEKMNKKTMDAIEQAALQAMKNDLNMNPSLSKQYGSSITSNATSIPKPSTPEISKQMIPKKDAIAQNKKPANITEKATAPKRKSEELPEAKIGKWETVKEPEKISLQTIKPVDLQLPKKYEKKLQPAFEPIEPKIEEKKIEEVKNKWVPISSFAPETKAELKEETFEEATSSATENIQPLEVKNEAATSVVNVKVEDNGEPEKIPSLKSSKKDKVAFKKRKVADTIQIRERVDE